MRIFGSVDSFVETAEKSLRIGRLVASFEFLKGLLSYGSFDAYHIYCPTLANLRLLQQKLEATVPDPQLQRVTLAPHFALINGLATTDYTAFHLGDWSWYLPKMAWLRARHAVRPFPLTGPIHSLDGPDMDGKLGELLDAPLAPWDRIICTSHPGGEAFHRQLAARRRPTHPPALPALAHIPLGVPDQALEPPARQPARQQLGIAPQETVLLYLGRISIAAKADLVPLLYVLHSLRSRNPDRSLRLIIAGGGDTENFDNLRTVARELGLHSDHSGNGGHGGRKAQEKSPVQFHANTDDALKATLLGAADIFVSPVDNLQETFGISILEAMAAGLPVVAANLDGYRDLVQEGETGLLANTLWAPPPEVVGALRPILEPELGSLAIAQGLAVDPTHLGDCLQQLIDDPARARAMGEAGKARVARDYTWRQIIPRYEKLWDELKLEADQASWPPAHVPPHPATRVFEHFDHYPSALLAAHDQLEITPLTQEILAGRLPMPATYAEVAPLLPGDWLPWLLEQCLPPGRTCHALLQAAEETGLPGDLITYQIVWLVKYGLLRHRRPA